MTTMTLHMTTNVFDLQAKNVEENIVFLKSETLFELVLQWKESYGH